MGSISTSLNVAASVLAQSSPEPDSQEVEQATQGFDSGQWLPALITFGVAVAIAVAARIAIDKLLRRYNDIISRLIARTIAAVVILVGVFYALKTLGIDVGLLVGALGVGGFAVAFAMRDTLENLISGVILQIRQPFDYHDTVKLGDYAGTVNDIDLRAVTMTTFDGEQVIIPSSTVLQNPIENWTANPSRRIEISVGVDYDTDIEQVAELVRERLSDVDGVLGDPAPDVVFDGFGGSSIDMKAYVWYDTANGSYFDVQRAAAAAIKRGLDEASIDIPFPIRTIRSAGRPEPEAGDSGSGELPPPEADDRQQSPSNDDGTDGDTEYSEDHEAEMADA